MVNKRLEFGLNSVSDVDFFFFGLWGCGGRSEQPFRGSATTASKKASLGRSPMLSGAAGLLTEPPLNTALPESDNAEVLFLSVLLPSTATRRQRA